MNYFILSGSHRTESQSSKVAQWIKNCIHSQDSEAGVEVFSLSQNPLPLWDEGVWDNKAPWPEIWGPISKKLQASDALIVITPEWGGMVPPGVKNFFLLCANKDLANKPGLIVSISSGMNGAYPVAELRMSSYKNNHICYIPDHVVIKFVEKVLNQKEPESKEDSAVRARLDYSLKMLEQYAKALNHVRQSGVPDYKTFPNGQ